jgi:hypothetical protein
MFEDDQPPGALLRRFTQEDLAAKTIKMALGLAPGGGLLAEFLTEFIPRQRIDRLQDFTEQLAARLEGVEDAFRARVQESAAYSSLVEQASLGAVRSASSRRRGDFAELLRTGLTLDDAAVIEHEALLRLLERLNDAQVLVLMSYGSFRQQYAGSPELKAFIAAHPGVFDIEAPTFGSSDEDAERRWTMREHYESELKTLGLLRGQQGSREPEITALGRLLLKSIGRPVVW